MQPGVSLTSISFKERNWGCVGSVKCILSNGEASNVIACNAMHCYEGCIEFDTDKPVRAVSAIDDGAYAYRIQFLDEAGNKLSEYSPYKYNR